MKHIFFALSLIIATGCARTASTPDAAPVPESLVVTCGTTGASPGGRGSGYVVHADGRVESYAGLTSAQGRALRGIAPPGDVRALWLRIQESTPTDSMPMGMYDGASRFYEVDTGDSVARRQWAVGPGAAAPDSTFARVFDACMKAANAAAEKAAE